MSYINSVDSRGIASNRVHFSHTKVESSARANAKSFSYHSYTRAKNSILTVIALLILVVVGFMLFNLIATPEYLVKREINSITADYYENYFYSAILKNNSIDPADVQTSDGAKDRLTDILDLYKDPGFARLTLRQLLLYDDQKHAGSTATLSKYCDLDKTQIKIYPESPYTRTNYRVDYTYSCKF